MMHLEKIEPGAVYALYPPPGCKWAMDSVHGIREQLNESLGHLEDPPTFLVFHEHVVLHKVRQTPLTDEQLHVAND